MKDFCSEEVKGKEGTDIEELVLGSADTFSYVNNIRVTKFNDDGSVEGELTVTPQSLNALGIVHGGCMATLADAVAGHAANRHGRCVTVNYAFNFLRPAKGTNKKIHCIALPEKVGVCMDTCHMSDAGYDIIGDLDGVLEAFDRVVGLARLRAVHINDSMNPPGSRKDRHARIGEGTLGTEAILRVITHPALQGLPFLLETPTDDAGHGEEIALLRRLAGEGA